MQPTLKHNHARYDISDHVVTEVSAAGVWNRGEVFAGGHHIATYAGGASGTTTFTHADWLGTERARTNISGTVIETCINLPFGDGQSCSGSGGDPSPLHFTGKQRDMETNNDDFGARYFNSGMGRWLTPDWSAKPAGTPYSDPANPQTLNLYAYVGNNPVTHTDPDGHDTPCQGGACGAQVGYKKDDGEIVYMAKTIFNIIFHNKEQKSAQKQAAEKLINAQNAAMRPKPPKMKGVNPVTNQPYFTPNPKGQPGNERPGESSGSGAYHAPRPANADGKHHGVDVAGAVGVDIHASTAGKVIESDVSGSLTSGMGNTVMIQDGNTVTVYGHLSDRSVAKGDMVEQGEVVGSLGQTGNASGQNEKEAHVHFEVRINGKAVDPGQWLNSAVEGPSK